ncbi:hypothetical protein D3C71_1148730 [compost metagenome]
MAKGQLVLQVQPALAVDAFGGAQRGDARRVTAVHRVEDVDRCRVAHCTAHAFPIGLLPIPAQQQGVVDRAGGEACLQPRVQRIAIGIAGAVGGAALLGAAIGVERTIGDHAAVQRIHVRASRALAQGEVIVELVLEQPACGPHRAVERVPARLADEGGVLHVAIRRGVERAGHRQKLVCRTAIILLVQAEQSDAGALGHLPGIAGRQEPVLLCGVLDLGVAVAIQADQAEQVVVVGRAGADVERRVVLAIGIHTHAQLLLLIRRRRLAHLVDHAARGDLTVHHRRRALEHFHPLQVPAVEHAAVPLRALRRAHAVQGDVVGPAAGIEATDAEVIHAVVDARALQADTGDIAHCIVERLHTARIQFRPLDHRYRLRGLGQRGVGFGRAADAVGSAVGIDAHRVQIGGGLGVGGGNECGGQAGQGQQVGAQPARMQEQGAGHGQQLENAEEGALACRPVVVRHQPCGGRRRRRIGRHFKDFRRIRNCDTFAYPHRARPGCANYRSYTRS